MEEVLIIVGMSSVALLWVFSVAGALATLWETFGEHWPRLKERPRR